MRKLALAILIISLSLLSHLAQAEKKDMLLPRHINLSGNMFHFSMPDDFNKDMPAADMVKWLDINDLNKFDNPKYENVIRRWWNIKEL